MKNKIIAAVVALASISSAHSSVTINFGMGEMYASTNTSTPFPVGGRLNLLALDSGSWSSLNLSNVFSQLTNSFVPAGATLVGSYANDDAGGPGSTGGAFFYSYAGNFTAGDELLLVAYPTLTLADTAPGLNKPGFFFRTDSIIDGSDIAWFAPADGATVSLFAYTFSQGGSLPNGQFTSGTNAVGGNGFTTVPEPSTYALLSLAGLALGGYAMRRRRRA